jgi:hypothetical protein
MNSEIKNILKLSKENCFSDLLYKTQLNQFHLAKTLVANCVKFIIDFLLLIGFSLNRAFSYIITLYHRCFDRAIIAIKYTDPLKKNKNIGYWLETFYPRVEVILRK